MIHALCVNLGKSCHGREHSGNGKSGPIYVLHVTLYLENRATVRESDKSITHNLVGIYIEGWAGVGVTKGQ